MAEITLKAASLNEEPLVVNLINGESESGEPQITTYKYLVKQMGGGFAARGAKLQAEFLRKKNGESIVGNVQMAEFMDMIRPATDDQPSFEQLLDMISVEQVEELVQAAVKTAGGEI